MRPWSWSISEIRTSSFDYMAATACEVFSCTSAVAAHLKCTLQVNGAIDCRRPSRPLTRSDAQVAGWEICSQIWR